MSCELTETFLGEKGYPGILPGTTSERQGTWYLAAFFRHSIAINTGSA
jgi:hypothetical protein